MADLALVTANRVSVVRSLSQLTLPANEAVTAGEPVRIDATTGNFVVARANNAGNARIFGIATRTVVAGEALTVIRKGIMDGWDLSALAYDAAVYLSDAAAGLLADAAGTVSTVVGRVIPGTATTVGTAYDKLLHVDL